MRDLVLLGGGLGGSMLSRALGHPAVELPIPAPDNGPARTILGAWAQQAAGLARTRASGTMSVRVLVSPAMPLPTGVDAPTGVTISCEHDKQEFRGTGGALRDLAEGYDDDDVLLVASANVVLRTPLHELAALLERTPGDIVLLAEPDGASSGIQLVRCGALRQVRSKGFIDFKEQALPQLAGTCDVRVARVGSTATLPVRTLDQYVRTLRELALPAASGAAHVDDQEEWTSTFSLVDASARVAAGVIVHDSVVLAGATVGAGAVLVRSLVCRGAQVKAGEAILDTIVPAQGGDGAR